MELGWTINWVGDEVKKKRTNLRLTPFGKKVKKRMIDLNMRQVELANQLGVSNQYLYRILNGDRSGKKYTEKIVSILEIEK